MRAGEKERLGVIRNVDGRESSSARSTSASPSTTLQVLSVLEKMIKQRKESLVAVSGGKPPRPSSPRNPAR